MKKPVRKMCYDKRYEDNDGENQCDKNPTEHLFETTAGYLFTLAALDIVGFLQSWIVRFPYLIFHL